MRFTRDFAFASVNGGHARRTLSTMCRASVVAVVFVTLANGGCKKERLPAPDPTASPAAPSVTLPPPAVTPPPIFDPAAAPPAASASAHAGTEAAVSTPLAATDFITLERTMCFGSCPAYTVTLRGDGSMTWAGTAHVATKHSGAKLDPAKVRALYDYAASSGFFGWRSSYRGGPTDHPSLRITITTKHKTHTVEVNPSDPSYAKTSGAPAALFDLGARIDAFAGSKRHIGNGQGPGGARSTIGF